MNRLLMKNRMFQPFAGFAFLMLIVFMTVGYARAAETNNLEPKHKVVIQVSSANPEVQTLALNNASNLQQMLGMDNVKVVIVAYGPGLSILTPKSIAPQRIQSLHAQGIEFDACHNTMLGIKRKTGHLPKLLAGVKVV
ncbi:MAG: hypothetical protein KGJ12_08620, partial [Gammaproteobacteria bacterium]|nr:hypothetical protein [Gammaproteobacteria bacterium]